MTGHAIWSEERDHEENIDGTSLSGEPPQAQLEEPEASHRKSTSLFVGLMALLMSLVAMAIDIMLPALLVIGRDLGVDHENEAQLIISALFLGLALGQMIYGPLSDRFGRKPPILAGLLVFILGAMLSLLATSFPVMLLGRVLQGVGIAGPRIVSLAMVRDLYSGDAMARIMSFILTVFILVPLIAPALGQGILLIGHWRLLFVALLLIALASAAWLCLWQPETLDRRKRRRLSIMSIITAVVETLRHPVTLGYTIAAGLIFGAFLGYLNSAAQILQVQYGLGVLFPFYFSALAFAFGAATLLNARLVMRLGMRSLSRHAIISLSVTSTLFLLITLAKNGHPELWALMAYLLIAFFAIGIMFGNFNALAMEPVGHIAGIAAGVIGTLTTLLSLLLGGMIGQLYDGTAIPVVFGFAVLGLLSLFAMLWAERGRRAVVPEG